jgi:uncharacterized membrane protein
VVGVAGAGEDYGNEAERDPSGGHLHIAPAREAVARRAYEISLTPQGATPSENWARAERELRGQCPPFPAPAAPAHSHRCVGVVKAVGRPRAPGLLLGIGLGGFVDGIVLHQILQWHHVLTSEGSYPDTTVAGLEANTFWDGVFHAATWVAVAAGIYILWRRPADVRWGASGHAFFGWMLVGWGLFNLVEGVVDHHVLKIHHVREDSAHQTAWDLAFLAFGGLLILGGWAIVSAGHLLSRNEDRSLARPSPESRRVSSRR